MPLRASDIIPLSFTKQLLSLPLTFPPHNLVIWTDGSVPFSFGKGSSGVLANCSLYGIETTLSFLPGPVCSSFSAEAWAIFILALAAPTSLPFISSFPFRLSLCRSFLRLSFYCKLCGRCDMNSLLSLLLLSGNNGSLDTRFSNEMRRLLSWPGRVRYFCPLQSFVLSLLLVFASTLLFFWTGGIPPLYNSLTCRLPRFPLKNLCPLITLALFFLSLLQQTQPFFLNPYLSRIDRIENPSSSACGQMT